MIWFIKHKTASITNSFQNVLTTAAMRDGFVDLASCFFHVLNECDNQYNDQEKNLLFFEITC